MHADGDLSPPGIAGLVVEVLDQLGIERVVLVGNDSGGVVSQLVVAATPERVRALVLVACDAFEIFPPGAYRILFRLAAVPGVMRFIGRGLAVPSIARSRFGYGAVIGRAPGAARHWTHPLRTDAGIRRDLTKLMKRSSNAQTLQAAEHFPAFAEPVLVVWARRDRLFPQALGRRLADAFPDGRLVTLEDARTFIPCDQPDPLAAVIAEFLDEHPNA